MNQRGRFRAGRPGVKMGCQERGQGKAWEI
jgi:hypothetical protein